VLRYLVEARWRPGEWVATEDKAVRTLRNALKRKKRVSLAERVALGKLVESALASRRDATAATIVSALARVAERSAPACSGDGHVGVNGEIVVVALNVAPERQAEFETAVADLDRDLGGRVDFRVHGPAEALAAELGLA
jgi:hypothetical protein